MTGNVHRTDIPVALTKHLRERMLVRADVKPARAVDDVRQAIAAGRVSWLKPSWVGGASHSSCLYVWTADERRAYAVKTTDEDTGRPLDVFLVTTVFTERRER